MAQYIHDVRICVWNITRGNIHMLGTTLTPKYGRARVSLRAQVPSYKEKGVFRAKLKDMDDASMEEIVRKVRSRHIKAGLETEASRTVCGFFDANWERVAQEYKIIQLAREKELRASLGPSLPPLVQKEEPVAAPTPDPEPEPVADPEPTPDPDPVADPEPVAAVSIVDEDALADLDLDDLLDSDKIDGLKMSTLRAWGRAFDPPVKGTSKSELAAELIEAYELATA